MKMYDFAMDVERAGRDFYQRMAESMNNPGPRRIFTMMAEEENRMLERFATIKQRAGKRELMEAELFTATDNVYRRQQPEQLRAPIQNDVDAYHLILELVNEVCQVYEQRVAKMDDAELRRELGEILKQERREYSEILHLYDFANAPNESLAWGEFSNVGEYPQFGHETEQVR